MARRRRRKRFGAGVVPLPYRSTEWAEVMAKLRAVKPSPLARACGKNQDPECVAKWKAYSKDWNAAYRFASKAQKKALPRDNADYVAGKYSGLGASRYPLVSTIKRVALRKGRR